MSRALIAKHGFDPVLMNLGFYPSIITDSLIAIADLKNDRELHFETESHSFDLQSPEDFEDDGNVIPSKIKKVVSKDNEWFDSFEIAHPQRTTDPFLFGIKNDKYYFICSWNTDIWEKE